MSPGQPRRQLVAVCQPRRQGVLLSQAGRQTSGIDRASGIRFTQTMAEYEPLARSLAFTGAATTPLTLSECG